MVRLQRLLNAHKPTDPHVEQSQKFYKKDILLRDFVREIFGA